jgi:hypothetical protein
MTSATKTKPTKTREEELAEQIDHHQAQLEPLERERQEARAAAQDLEGKVEALLADFKTFGLGMPGGLEELREQARAARQREADLITRANAYRESIGLTEMIAELDQLTRQRRAQEGLNAAADEAKTLIEELEFLFAWLFRSHIQRPAVERRCTEGVLRLMEIQNEFRLGLDVPRFTKLGGEVAPHAGQYLRLINADADPDFWRRNLPELEALELPEELRAATTVVSGPHVDQVGARTFDPMVPKDQAMRRAAGAQPIPRNPDGTPAGSAPLNVVRAPRTEAEDRARRATIAAELEAEDAAKREELAATAKEGG